MGVMKDLSLQLVLINIEKFCNMIMILRVRPRTTLSCCSRHLAAVAAFDLCKSLGEKLSQAWTTCRCSRRLALKYECGELGFHDFEIDSTGSLWKLSGSRIAGLAIPIVGGMLSRNVLNLYFFRKVLGDVALAATDWVVSSVLPPLLWSLVYPPGSGSVDSQARVPSVRWLTLSTQASLRHIGGLALALLIYQLTPFISHF